jgi:hypothetical protein
VPRAVDLCDVDVMAGDRVDQGLPRGVEFVRIERARDREADYPALCEATAAPCSERTRRSPNARRDRILQSERIDGGNLVSVHRGAQRQ